MTDPSFNNGHADGRIRFGPKDHQHISRDVAEMMLTMWRERQPAVFGAYLAEAMTGARPRAQRSADHD